MNNVQPQISNALKLLQSNQFKAVIKHCETILKHSPNVADAHYLKAISHQRLQQKPLAIKHFHFAIELSPSNPEYYVNCASMYLTFGELLLAKEILEKAIAKNVTSLNLKLKIAQVCTALQDNHSALNHLKSALPHTQSKSNVFVKIGNCYKQLQQLESAITFYDEAISSDQRNLLAYVNKAIVLRSLGRTNEAIASYEFLLANGARTPDVYCNYGCALHDAERFEESERAIREAIKLDPNHTLAHEALNSRLWESNRKNEFLKSYDVAIKKEQVVPHEVYYSKAAQLILAQSYSQAQELIEEAIKVYPNSAHLTHELATIYFKQNINLEKANNMLFDAVNMAPDNSRFRIDLAANAIKAEQYEEAEKHLAHAIKLNRDNQEAWAYQGLNWRLRGDDRHEWLNDYDKFIVAAPLAYPSHYKSLDAFLSVLKEKLISLHTSDDRPLDQSVRGGTQTLGNLLTLNDSVIQEYKASLERNITNYLSRLTFDENHPLLRRITKEVNIGGCWSVMLKGEGYHTNHVHPDGWLSGPTYINVPKEITPDDKTKSGWVKFGQTSLGLGKREQIGKEVCPTEGLCVFFPSYIWHGTNSFHSNDVRITAPCDIFPIN